MAKRPVVLTSDDIEIMADGLEMVAEVTSDHAKARRARELMEALR